MPTLCLVVVILIISAVVASWIWTIKQSSQNDAQPQTSTEALVASINDINSGMFVRAGTNFLFNFDREYYITFELQPSKERRKFSVPVDGNKAISEGDVGVLKFQGTRFLGFRHL